MALTHLLLICKLRSFADGQTVMKCKHIDMLLTLSVRYGLCGCHCLLVISSSAKEVMFSAALVCNCLSVCLPVCLSVSTLQDPKLE